MDLTVIEKTLLDSPDWEEQAEKLIILVNRVVSVRRTIHAIETIRALFAEHVKGKVFDPTKVNYQSASSQNRRVYHYDHGGVTIFHYVTEGQYLGERGRIRNNIRVDGDEILNEMKHC